MEDRARVCALLGSAIRLVLGIVLGCTVFSAGAIPVLDQSQSDTSELLANFGGSGLLLVQSFKQSNKNIAGAGIFAYLAQGANPASGDITVALFGKLPETLDEKPLVSATGLATQGQWLDLFWKPLDLGDDTHYLVFTGENVRMGLAGAKTDPYEAGLMSLGEAQAAPTLALNALSSSIKYTAFPDYDFAFRTYYDQRVLPVPEPGTLALFALAFAGLTFARRPGRPRRCR